MLRPRLLNLGIRLTSPQLACRTAQQSIWSPNSARGFKSTSCCSSRNNKAFGRLIRTLDPSKLLEKDQAISDLSGMRRPVPYLDGNQKSEFFPSVYFARDQRLRVPFPADTRGVFYFHHDPAHPALSGGIRFWLCDTQADFSRGQDLINSTLLNQPWEIPLLSLHGEKSRPVREFLAREGLVQQEILEVVEKLKYIGKRSHLLGLRFFFLGQSVIMDLSRCMFTLTFITRRGIIPVRVSGLFAEYQGNEKLFEGVAKVRLEVNPETKDPASLVLRFVELLTPVSQKGDGLTNVVITPQVGELYSRKTDGGRGEAEPWVLSLRDYLSESDVEKLVSSPEWTWTDSISK